MTVLDDRYQKRRRIFDRYVKELSDIPGIGFMPEPGDAKSNRWLTVMTIDPDEIHKSPEDIRLAMEEHNIETRRAWKPMHMQPVFEARECVGGKVCEQIFERTLCLPSGSSLTESEQTRVIQAIRQYLK